MKSKRLKGIYRMPGSKYWWFWYQQNGQRHAVSLRTEEEGEAITRAHAILAQGLIAAEEYNRFEPPARRREIHGLIDQYLKEARSRNKEPVRTETANGYGYILGKWVADRGISRVGDITLSKIEQWLTALKTQGKSQDTRWGYGQRVRHFINYLIPKYLPATTLEGLILPEHKAVGRKNWIRSTEVSKILDATNSDRDLKFALFCGFDAGLRRNEVSEARINWFDLRAGRLHVSNNGDYVTKDRENRTIPFTDRFAEFLKGYLAGRDSSEYVLAPEKTVKGKNKYRYDVNKRVRSHFDRLKVKCTFHDMRRSFASNRASVGVSIYKIANWLGDGVEVVSRSYGHLAPQDRTINLGV
jgi:integrase